MAEAKQEEERKIDDKNLRSRDRAKALEVAHQARIDAAEKAEWSMKKAEAYRNFATILTVVKIIVDLTIKLGLEIKSREEILQRSP